MDHQRDIRSSIINAINMQLTGKILRGPSSCPGGHRATTPDY